MREEVLVALVVLGRASFPEGSREETRVRRENINPGQYALLISVLPEGPYKLLSLS